MCSLLLRYTETFLDLSGSRPSDNSLLKSYFCFFAKLKTKTAAATHIMVGPGARP
jgi:hypothetical protein